MYKTIFQYRTIFADLDTQRHVNSNRYFDLFESGKYLLLEELGFPIQYLFSNHMKVESCRTNFKFFKQVVENKVIKVEITLLVFNDGYLNWACEISLEKEILVKINSINKINPSFFKSIITENYSFDGDIGIFDLNSGNAKKYSFESELRHVDRNYFGQIPENISWRLFEENRWKHSRAIGVTLDLLNRMDLAFFWYEGDCRFARDFQADESIKSSIWFQQVTDFRLIYAHEIIDLNNKIIYNSISTFVPVSISTGRPKKIPTELVDVIAEFIIKVNHDFK